LEVPAGIHNCVIYLAVPVRRPGAVDVLPQDNTQGLARYYSNEIQVRDVTVEGGDSQSLDIAKLRLRLLLETDDLSGYACIGLIRVAEARDDKDILLDEQYFATCLDCKAVPRLAGFIPELAGLLHHRGESIAGRLADARRGGTAEIADYMLLQLVNRLEPFVNHMANIKGLHPLTLYSEFMQMAGELSTFVTKTKRPPSLPAYLHDNLQQTFTPVLSLLSVYLSMVYGPTGIALNLVAMQSGIRVSEMTDRLLLSSAMFVLAVRADVKDVVIRTRPPVQFKIGPVQRIRQLVNAAMP